MIVTKQGASTLCHEGVRLKPGANIVDLAWWEKAKKHPGIKKRLEAGSLVEETDPKEAKKGGKALDFEYLGTLKPGQAVALVKETVEMPLLEGWLKKESRKMVGVAIKKQIELLKAPAEKRDRSESRQITTGKGPDVMEVKASPNASDD